MIKYSVPVNGPVTIKIYNTVGQEIETILQSEVTAGLHELHWTTKNLSSGVYLYRMQSGQYSETKRMIYQK